MTVRYRILFECWGTCTSNVSPQSDCMESCILCHSQLGLQIVKEDDNEWPAPDRVGRQELEVVLADQHISFCTTKLGSLMQVQQSKDPDGLRVFYYLVQVSCSVSFVCTCTLLEDNSVLHTKLIHVFICRISSVWYSRLSVPISRFSLSSDKATAIDATMHDMLMGLSRASGMRMHICFDDT